MPSTRFYSIAAATFPGNPAPLGEDYFLDAGDAGHTTCITKRYTDAAFVAEFGEGFLIQRDTPLCYEGIDYAGPQELYEAVFRNREPDRSGQMINTRWFDSQLGYVWKFKP